jgi:type IV secretory pathway VirB2 component (pilin)
MRNLLNLNPNRTLESVTGIEILKGMMIVSVCSLILFAPDLAFASVESSLSAVQDKLVGTLLPLAAMCGLVIAGLSFVAGHANARQHLVYAIIGAIVGFGSESIVSFIRNLIH